jgi:hypothetical protein
MAQAQCPTGARFAKALKLAHTLREAGVTSDEVCILVGDEEFWRGVALVAEVKPPSVETQTMVLGILISAAAARRPRPGARRRNAKFVR